MVPFSSQMSKYRRYYNSKVSKYKNCDIITFGNILGHEKAFLIQNMCPVSQRYIKNEYYDPQSNIPVKIDGVFVKELEKKVLDEYFNVQVKQSRKNWVDGLHGHVGVEYLNLLNYPHFLVKPLNFR